MAQNGPRFGLVKSGGRQVGAKPGVLSAFDEDDDTEAAPSLPSRTTNWAASHERQAEAAAVAAAAMQEDPNIFDFDGWKESAAPRQKPSVNRHLGGTIAAEPGDGSGDRQGARYITSLLGKAGERTREREAILDRKMAKEHAAEEAMYGEKEKFVTSAYAAKLEERRAAEEAEKRRTAQEEANDVTKKGDMGDFYRNLLTHNTAFGGSTAAAKPASSAAAAGTLAAGTSGTNAPRAGDAAGSPHVHISASVTAVGLASNSLQSTSSQGSGSSSSALPSTSSRSRFASAPVHPANVSHATASAASAAGGGGSAGVSSAAAAPSSSRSAAAQAPSSVPTGAGGASASGHGMQTAPPPSSSSSSSPPPSRVAPERSPEEAVEGYRERALARFVARKAAGAN